MVVSKHAKYALEAVAVFWDFRRCLAQVPSASVVAWIAAVHVHGSVAACSLLGASFFVACRKIPSAVQVPAHGVQDPAHDSLCSRLVGGTRLCSCVSCSHFP